MPVTAATLEEAIANTNPQVRLAAVGSLLLSLIGQFTDEWPTTLDALNEGNLTVLYWLPQSSNVIQQVAAQTPSLENAQIRQNVVNIICRVCFAAIAAEDDGRITTAQRDAILDAWNDYVGIY